LSKSENSIGVKFTKDGPSIPIELLQSLTNGDVVIFCGAGISRYLGLPDFKGLVEEVCTKLNRPMLSDEQESYKAGAFDLTLGLIESRIGKNTLRQAVRGVLEVKRESDLSTHRAILQLATNKNGQVRLVTTNFDRAFELAQQGSHDFEYAPYLPHPDKAWDSVVHVHGGLGSTRDPNGDSLVFTSADFGRAYLTEAWASRFLSELFRRASAILFVGYSVSDPAIRYIVDAFAADRSGQTARIAKAFLLLGGTESSETWNSRGIEPIVYDPRDDHTLLHETLRNCAKRYRSGFFDRESIVLEYAPQSPLGGLDPESISQITWALSDESGYAARRFAGLDPPPPIEWLDTLEAEGLLGIGPRAEAVVLPAPMVARSPFAPPLRPTSAGLCTWMCAHMANPLVVRWAVRNGAHLHPFFAQTIRQRLASQKQAIIPLGARLIWEFLAAEYAPIFSPTTAHQVLLREDVVASQAWNPLLRDLVLSWLSPRIQFKQPFLWSADTFDPESVKSYADLELTPAAAEGSWTLADRLLGRLDASKISGELLGDLTSSLEKGLTYLAYLQGASDDYDGTYSSLPSIDDHPQNDRLRHWPVYVFLIREAWTRVSAMNPAQAREEVSRWMRVRFPLFRRMVLWAAGKPGGLSPSESINYLSTQPASAVWGLETHRELLQYLTRIASSVSNDDADRLAEIIVSGPPRHQFRADLTDEQFREISDQEIHIRLAKLRDGGMTLPEGARELLARILSDHPGWDRPTTERDEFLMWFDDGGWVGMHDPAPQLDDYLNWDDKSVLADLRANATNRETIARWRGLLAQDAPRSVGLLRGLANDASLNGVIWSLALTYLSGEQTLSDLVGLFGTIGFGLGQAFITEHLQQLSNLVDLYGRAKNKQHDEGFWALWDQLLDPSAQAVPEDAADPAFTALNSSIGNLTESLLAKIGQLNPTSYGDVPELLRARLEGLLKGTEPAHRLSRLLLAKALAWLYRVNPELARVSLLVRLDWATSQEAKYIWIGYLMSARITPDLWAAIRPMFLATFLQVSALGKAATQFYSVFAFVLLHEEFVIDAADARLALTRASSEGRSQLAWYWWRQTDSATEYGATLFRERLKYLLTEVWPLELDVREEGTSSNLARLASSCGTAFQDAVAVIVPLLATIDDTATFLWSFKDKDHAEKYPESALALINAIVGDHVDVWSWPHLRNILERIAAAQPALTSDIRFARLDELVRRYE
jgi:hypothetical protein